MCFDGQRVRGQSEETEEAEGGCQEGTEEEGNAAVFIRFQVPKPQ